MDILREFLNAFWLRPEVALIKMIGMSQDKGSESFAEFVAAMNVVPVSISYEWDPLDAAKAREQGLDVTLDLYGKGEPDYEQQLKDECANLGLGDAAQFKSTTPEQMRRVYSEYDALLFTSNWGEPFALTPLDF